MFCLEFVLINSYCLEKQFNRYFHTFPINFLSFSLDERYREVTKLLILRYLQILLLYFITNQDELLIFLLLF